jgi:undecaprenyl-diphosphatase
MTIIQSIILGIIQGLTEFIPISSSAHLVITKYLLGWNIPNQEAFIFDVIIHLGTLIAVVIYFWKDIWKIIRAVVTGIIERQPFKDDSSRLGWIIILATIPAVVVGVLFKSQVEQAFSKPIYSAIFLLVTALFLVLAEIIGHRRRQIEAMNWIDGLVIGLFQAVSLLPGISRSGSAITGGMIRDLDRQSSARFSFLLSIPAILGAALLTVVDLIKSHSLQVHISTLVVGFVVSAIVGYLAIRWFISYLGKRSLYIFAIYCVVVSIVVITLTIVKPG